MEEAEKVANLMKRVAEDAFCELEEAQRAHLAVYHHLPNITQSVFMPPGTLTMDGYSWAHVREIF